MTTQGRRSGGAVALAAASAIGLFLSSASANVILTFGFTDLDTSFDFNSSQFTANAVDAGALETGGDVSRLTGGGGTADFGSGFMSLGTLADFQLGMTISNVVGNTADGAGSLTITDANGDSITGNIDGDWELIGGSFYVFSGLLDTVFVNDNSGDGLFDGPTGGAFSTSLGAAPPYSGASVYLFFGNFGGFFDQDFSGLSGQISGEIIPAPGSAVLVGLGGLIAMRRRR